MRERKGNRRGFDQFKSIFSVELQEDLDEENDREEEDELSGREEEGLALRCAVCRQNCSLACVFSRIFIKNFRNQCFGSALVTV
jgi:hypothetical protein